MKTTLIFCNVTLTAIERNDEIWFSSKDIAIALGYSKTNAITHIYNVNCDEFTPGMTEIVESTTSGNLRSKSRFFSLRGTHLISMLARTSIAKEFRRWVLDLLDKESARLKEAYIAKFNHMEAELHVSHDRVINGDSRTLLIRLDESGNIKFTEKVPDNACVCTLVRFEHMLKQQGFLIIPKCEITKAVSETLEKLALEN